jgi:alpha-D-xyloside xylohydrolase
MGVGGRPNTLKTLGQTAMDGLHDAAVLHYELFPYLYRLLQARQPVLRPLGYGYPADPGSWAATYELLVGPDLLSSPVTGPGTTPTVYLPPGRWIDLYGGVAIQGEAFTRRRLAQFPPMCGRAR